jgi:hypothetical protein
MGVALRAYRSHDGNLDAKAITGLIAHVSEGGLVHLRHA